MAKFSCTFSEPSGGGFSGNSTTSEMTSEDILSILRPAAEALKEYYKKTLRRIFKQHSGILAESPDFIAEVGLDRSYMDLNEAVITVGLRGKHPGSKRAARSRAGSPTKKYAKHNRKSGKTSISNAELGYLLEYGTPRIQATHWMENANEEIAEEIQDIIEEGYAKLLEKRGL